MFCELCVCAKSGVEIVAPEYNCDFAGWVGDCEVISSWFTPVRVNRSM